MRKLFSLSIENETLEELSRIAATRQLKTGEKISVTAIINEAVSEYLKTSGLTQGDPNNEIHAL